MKGLHSRNYLAAIFLFQSTLWAIIIRTSFYEFIFTPFGFSYCIWQAADQPRINGHDFKNFFMARRGGID